MTIYNKPLYYEIAFDFVDIQKQIKLFENLIKKYAKLKKPANRVLDICCGPSLQLRALAKKGYECYGLDSNRSMLKHLRDSAKAEGVEVHTVHDKMDQFVLRNKADFAFNLMGSIAYVKDKQELLNHFSTVAGQMNKGGLYLI